MRHGVSTVALLAGQPQTMISYDLNHDSTAELLKSRQGKTAFSFVQGDSLSVGEMEAESGGVPCRMNCHL